MPINRKDRDEHKIVPVIIEGGHSEDPDPQMAGRVRGRPLHYGPLVKTEHLPFIQQQSNSQGSGQYEFNRPPRPGQMAMALGQLDGYMHIVGLPIGIEKAAKAFAGGTALDSFIPQMKKAATTLTGMKIPPKVKGESEANRTGLEKAIKTVDEKTEEDRHQLYQGVPTHGAMPIMSGLVSQPLKQVSTALNQLDAVLSGDILSQLPGQFQSLGSILDLLDSDTLKTITDKLGVDLTDGLNNMMTLMQSETQTPLPGNFTIGGMVNPATLLPKLIDKLSSVANFGDLNNALSGVLSDIHASDALDGLENIVQELEGVFGKISISISADGSLLNTLSKEATALESAFSSLVSSIPNPNTEGVFFGSDTKIPELMKRLSTKAKIAAAKTNLQQKSPQDNAARYALFHGSTNSDTGITNGFTLGSRVLTLGFDPF